MKIEQPTKPYHKDHSIVYSCQYHIIFCPKYRRKVLVDAVDRRLKELILDKQSDYGYQVVEMNIMPEHVHLLLDVDPRVGVNKVVGRIKGFTSHELREEFPHLKKRLPTLWTRSKFISTVGAVTLESVQKYIENQKNV
jgi:REP-associated tyrosine transposase